MDVPWSLSLDNHTLIAKAAVAGVGLAYVAETEVADHISAGRLIAVLADWMPVDPGFCLYYPSRGRSPDSVRALVEVIKGVQC